jgi:Tfp pilus assembly PilM family ATPase
MAKKILSVLEITETHIKLVQARQEPRGGVITNFIVENISSPRDEVISEQLGKLIKQTSPRPTNLIAVIPRNLVIVRNLNLPSHNPIELAKMAELQVIRQIPYAKQDLVINHSVVEKDPSGYSKVLVVIVHKDVINRYLKIINPVATADLFVLSSQGIINWYSVYSDKKRLGQEDVSVLFNFDTTSSDVCFFYKGQLLFSRSIIFGLKDFGSKNLDDVIRQIHLTFSSYKKEKIGREISRLILMPSCDNTRDFSIRLQEELAIPTQVLDVQSIIALDKGISLPAQINRSQLCAASVLGFAISERKDFLDLLPPEAHRQRTVHARKREFITLGVLLFFTVASFICAIYVKVYKKERHLKALEEYLDRTNSEADDITKMGKRLKLIKQRIAPEVSSIDVIYELYNLLPQNMSLRIFEQDGQGNLVLQGIALAMSDVFNFQGRLDKSEYFSNVEVRYTRNRKTRKGELTDFMIVCKITK